MSEKQGAKKESSSGLVFVLVIILIVAVSVGVYKAQSADALVATVGDYQLMMSEVDARLAELPEEYRETVDKNALIQSMIDELVLKEQARMELTESLHTIRKPMFKPRDDRRSRNTRPPRREYQPRGRAPPRQAKAFLKTDEKGKFKELLEGLIGTKGAYILDNNQNILGKVPMTELNSTLKSMSSGVYAIVFDGVIDKDVVEVAEGSHVKHIIAMDSKIDSRNGSINIVTAEQL